MTPEIKTRIFAINSGIIPEGYKKTKVGIVPVEWKQVKLGEILKQRKTLMCVSEDAPLLSFTIEEGVIEPTDKKTNKRDFLIKDISTKKFALTEVGDVIYNPANLKFGAIHRNNLRKGVVSPIYGIFYGKQDSVFMGNLLHNQRFIDYAKIYTEGTVEKLKTLKAETFLKLKVVIPPLPEQQKIAEILSTQDKLIELQEKKIEQLKELKKAYLQKMFPKKGSKYPEIRFKGFTDPWEQRKWSETVSISTEMVDPRSGLYDDFPHVAPGNIESFTGRVFDNVKTVKEEELISGKFRFRKGDIIYGKINPQLGKYAFAQYDGLTSADAYVLNAYNGVNQKYLFAVLQTKDFYDYSVSVSRRSGMPKINRNELNAYSFTAPNEEEQGKIGEFFLSIDYLITLHQHKLEQEKQNKKALMQLLLTGKVRVKL